MSKLLHSILAGVLLLIGLATQVHAAKRVALVVGNSSYESQRLVNPSHDADDVERVLKSLHFQVTKLKDVSKQEFEAAVDEITERLAKGDVCLIFYAGHGMQMEGQNYLVPVKTVVDRQHHVAERCVSVSFQLRALEYSGCSLKVVIVDACRNNPFRGFSRSTPGFAALQAAPEGTIVSVSTSPGAVALEGSGNNSPFAKHLVNTLTTQASKSHLVDLFFDTSRAVAKETGQRPILQVDAAMPRFYLGSVDSTESMRPRPPVESPAPRDTITNRIGMKFNLIPAGTFTMGSPVNEEGRDDDEVQYQVTISKPYYLQTTEVTQGQWTTVMGTKPWEGKSSVREGSDYAASWVCWDDAVEFCRKLSASDPDHSYRLPTEAEWEYACRGGTQTAYSFGDDAGQLAEYAWFDGNAYNVDERYTHRVAQKRPNPFGLHDMHGNVNEWCSDWYDRTSHFRALFPQTNPQGPSSGSSRVMRGGSWFGRPRFVRSANRSGYMPVSRNNTVGFRVLCESD